MPSVVNLKTTPNMDNLSWSAKRRSTGSLGASGSRDATLSKTFSMGRADKELLVYRRRSVQEREASAARFREEEAADGLNQLGVFTYTTQVLPVPKSRPKGMIKLKKYKHQLREGGPTEVLPYYVEPNLEEKVKAGVILCWLRKGMKKIKDLVS
jgi:hypothetical protein